MTLRLPLILLLFLWPIFARAEREFYARHDLVLTSRVTITGTLAGGVLFQVAKDSRLFIKVRSGDWLLVVTPEGKSGWVPSESVGEREAMDKEGPQLASPYADELGLMITSHERVSELHQTQAELEEDDPSLYDCLTELERITEPAEFRQVIEALERKFPGISFTSPIAGRACILSGRRFGCYKHPILRGHHKHDGIDLAAQAGTPLLAPSDECELVSQQWSNSYGRQVFLKCGEYTFSYNHLAAYANRGLNKQGHKYKKGETIGYVGSSGRSSGPHLHFEVYKNGERIDPMSVFDETVLCKAKLVLQKEVDCSKRGVRARPKGKEK